MILIALLGYLKSFLNIAAIIVEPIPVNMNCILPNLEFLQQLRDICTQYSALLIFDEVITRISSGIRRGTERYGISPDLTTLGKIIGGGMPTGAFGDNGR